MKKITIRKNAKFKATFFFLILALVVVFINACNKEKTAFSPSSQDEAINRQSSIPVTQNKPITLELTVANIRLSTAGNPTIVLFYENEQVFLVSDPAVLANLQEAFSNGNRVKVTFDPWKANVSGATVLTGKISRDISSNHLINSGTTLKVDLKSMSNDMIDSQERMGVINTTTTGLTSVIPDMATAQLMFNYITKQCCKLPGPYDIDYCISFQYAEDGCYARAHKMCHILNTKYHYDTHKIFSFAVTGSDVLGVEAQKWGGCCVNWWYHVAPLVNIKTAAGTKAYVFDPAMFDQPVLLSAWLHAQENPDCGGSNAHVSMISVQPTAAFWPDGGSGTAMSYGTDPDFYNTNFYLTLYSTLTTCP